MSGGLKSQLIKALASVGGLGYLPLAPGTWGSLAALPIWWALRDASVATMLAVAVAATGLAILSAQAAEDLYGDHDVQHIVVDEVAGMLWMMLGGHWELAQVVAGFVLFRLFDALKPPPVGWIDRHVGGGLGVVLDDVAAGIMAAAVLYLGTWGLARL